MKRTLCLAAVMAVLLAPTSCDREPTLQEIFESQYGNAYIYENGEHRFLYEVGQTVALRSDKADYIDNSLPYVLKPLSLDFNMDAARDPFPGNLEQYGSMKLRYVLTNNSDLPVSGYFVDNFVEQYIDGEWYQCITLNDLPSIASSQPSIVEGESETFSHSLAFIHYNYNDPEELRDPDRGGIDLSNRPDMYPDRYINFPAGRYRVVCEVGWQKYVSLEFDLVYEDGMCYLHTVEDE